MSAEDEGGAAASAGGPSAGQEGQAAQVELGVYKNPELIESVVVFDPIGGANQRFLDTMEVSGLVCTYDSYVFNSGTAQAPRWEVGKAWNRGGVQLHGQNVTTTPSGNYQYGSDYTKFTVCREIDNPGGQSRMDVRTATNPINFRFDGVPMILPRESYIELTLRLIYLGTGFDYDDMDEVANMLDFLMCAGWSRTSSSMIQLVSAVDVSATSFQSPDMTTQNFLEALTTKDTELKEREGQVYFNSYVSEDGCIPRFLMRKVTKIDIAHDAPGSQTRRTYDGPYATTPEVGAVEFETIDSAGSGELNTGEEFEVVFRIPLSHISPVFKVDVLPLFLTNSTNINIQLQVQNPNVGFPLHNFLGGNPDCSTYLNLQSGYVTNLACIQGAGLTGWSDSTKKVMAPAKGTLYKHPERVSKPEFVVGSNRWDLDGANPFVDQTYVIPGAIDTFNYASNDILGSVASSTLFENSVGGGTGDNCFRNTLVASQYTKMINSLGVLSYLYWKPEFTIRAFVKTYASPYNNPLVNRYLRPYMVGPEGAATFFRSAFLSYNFNAMTYVVPGNSSIPFNFNISQTLINVPMAYLLFSEISYSVSKATSKVVPAAIEFQQDSGVMSAPTNGGDQGETYEIPNETICLKTRPLDSNTSMNAGNSVFLSSPYYGVATGSLSSAITIFNPVNFFRSVQSARVAGVLAADFDATGYGATLSQMKTKSETVNYGLLDVFHRSQYLITDELEIHNVQVSIGPSGWNLYQRPLDMKAMNEITLNTLTRYDSELVWKDRVCDARRWYRGDAFACFDLSHDMYRGLFIDADNMLNITGTLTNHSSASKTVYIQCILPYMDHFVINLQDSTVTKSQL